MASSWGGQATAMTQIRCRLPQAVCVRRRAIVFSGLLPQIAGSVACRLMGLGRLVVFARLLGPEQFGAFRLASTVSTILSALGGLGLYTAFLRFLPEASGPAVVRLTLQRCLGVSLAAGTLCCVVLLVLASPFAQLLFAQPGFVWLAVLVALSLPVTVVYKSFLGAEQGLGRFRRSSAGEALQNAVFFVAGAGLLVGWRGHASLAFGSFLVGMLVSVVWLWPGLELNAKQPAATSLEREQARSLFLRALRFSAWYAIIPLFQYLFDFIDRWMLTRFINLEQAGAYSLVPVIAGGIGFLGTSLSVVVARRGAWLLGRGRGFSSRRLVWAALCLCAFGSLCYGVAVRLAEPLIWRFAGPRWAVAAPVLPVLLFYFSAGNSSCLVGVFSVLREKAWVNLAAGILGTAVNTLLNLWLVPRLGMMGAALGTLGGMAALTGVHIVFIIVSGIGFPFRALLSMLLPAAVVLPGWAALAVLFVCGVLAKRTNLFLTDSERRIVAGWVIHVWRRFAVRLRAGGSR